MIRCANPAKLWVFLGDSLTEGIGSRRISWVSQLTRLLRADAAFSVHAARLRILDLSSWRDLAHFNLAGHLDLDEDQPGAPLWLMNLAAESTTITNDLERSSFIAAMRPSRVFILRGPLETIVRPRETVSGRWPFWVPHSWRGYAAMDPRCYFSSTSWRRSKQVLLDKAKQRVRLSLLQDGGEPLLSDEQFLLTYDAVVAALIHAGTAPTILTLPPVSNETFPGTMQRVAARNRGLADLARNRCVDILEWPQDLDPSRDGLFCRDGFHPTKMGALELAKRLHEHLTESGSLVAAVANG